MNRQIRRNVFETNSSSSHSLTIANTDGMLVPLVPDENGEIIVDHALAECMEFGWQWDKHYDVGSKIVYSYRQAYDVAKVEWLEMLDKVIKDHSGAKSVLYDISEDYDSKNYASIDHQSSSTEGSNTEMFDSEVTLRNFLFNRGSFIQTGNDNEDTPEGFVRNSDW